MVKRAAPDDLRIVPRNYRFGVPPQRWWANGDPFATALYNSLSLIFPAAETFFIESVRAFATDASPRLATEIAAFMKQEATHNREHLAFNRHLLAMGYDPAALDARLDARLTTIRKRPPIVRLAATMALEHFTAMLAHELLSHARNLRGAEPRTADLWRWHALEEIEHKGVAYDTWLHATRDWSRARRWRVKAAVMLLVTRNFVADRVHGMSELLRQDGIAGPRAWWGIVRAALLLPGVYRGIPLAWAAFFLPGFHPWNADDRGLIRQAESDFSDAVFPGSGARQGEGAGS